MTEERDRVVLDEWISSSPNLQGINYYSIQDKWNNHLKSPFSKRNYDLFQDKKPYDHTECFYWTNEYGERIPPPDMKVEKYEDTVAFIGCSLTFGMGVKYEDTFAYLISEKLKMNCRNLGGPGASPWSCYRVAKIWLPKIKPKVVFYAQPSSQRWHMWSESRLDYDVRFKEYALGWTPLNGRKHPQPMPQEFYLYEKNSEWYHSLVTDAIKGAYPSAKLIPFPMYDFYSPDTYLDLGSDNGHPGRETHKMYMEEMLEIYYG